MRPTATTAEIDWLYGLQHFGIKLGLDNIRALLETLGRPDRAYPSALIAGTNGKGSVTAMLHAMLAASGVRAGMFTSPHLVRPNERIRIGPREIDDDELHRRLRDMRATIEAALERGRIETHPSFFEVIAATALKSFADHGLGAALLEVGLGGRLDATNAVDAALSVIVSVDLDHTKTLGSTVGEIAREKGGIVKPGKTLVSGVVRPEALEVLRRICDERAAPMLDALAAVRLVERKNGAITLESEHARYPELRLALAGEHQTHNARVAIAAFERLARVMGFEPDPAAVRDGLARTRWPGRLQWVRDGGRAPLLFDGAHNPAGAQVLAEHLGALGLAPPVALFGIMHGKLLEEMIATLGPHLSAVVVTRPTVQRSADPEEVARVVRDHVSHVEIVPDPAAALARARDLTPSSAYTLVTGSLYLVGEILGLFESDPAPGPVSL